MKCARLHLTERMRRAKSSKAPSVDRPRRYCQKRMINPEHEEDPRWMDALKRFHCLNLEYKEEPEIQNESNENANNEDNLFLSVQNIQFQGNTEDRKRPKSCFKYKAATDGNKHRLFVKEAISNEDLNEEERSSQLTSSYLEDYMQYVSNDPSRPSSGKLSILNEMSSNVKNKATQVETNKQNERKTNKKIVFQLENGKTENKKAHVDLKCEGIPSEVSDVETKVSFHKSGKRKSLTISRVQSPETVQVIRVDVVCNYSCSSDMSEYDDININNKDEQKVSDKENVNIKGTFASKYLLTSSMKPLDEKAGKAKVTLMCKTFRLAERQNKSIK